MSARTPSPSLALTAGTPPAEEQPVEDQDSKSSESTERGATVQDFLAFTETLWHCYLDYQVSSQTSFKRWEPQEHGKSWDEDCLEKTKQLLRWLKQEFPVGGSRVLLFLNSIEGLEAVSSLLEEEVEHEWIVYADGQPSSVNKGTVSTAPETTILVHLSLPWESKGIYALPFHLHQTRNLQPDLITYLQRLDTAFCHTNSPTTIEQKQCAKMFNIHIVPAQKRKFMVDIMRCLHGIASMQELCAPFLTGLWRDFAKNQIEPAETKFQKRLQFASFNTSCFAASDENSGTPRGTMSFSRKQPSLCRLGVKDDDDLRVMRKFNLDMELALRDAEKENNLTAKNRSELAVDDSDNPFLD